MRGGLPFFAIAIWPLVAISSAEAVPCDCNKKIGKCAATANFIGRTSWIEFRSNTPECSFITYRLNNEAAPSITITDGYDKDEYFGDPRKALPTINGISCVICATVDETRRTAPERSTRPARSANKEAPEPPSHSSQPQAPAQRQVIHCPENYVPEGAPNAAEHNQLVDQCREQIRLPGDPPLPTKAKKAMTAKELEALRREGEAKIKEGRARATRQQQEADKENSQIKEMEEQQRKREQAVKKQQPREQTLYEQERKRQQRQQTWNTIFKAIGAGVGAGVNTYNAVPKNPQPLPPQPSYKQRKVQRPSVAAPTPPTTTTTHTNCPGNAAADENCNALH
jgi:hypothetical protein